MRSCPVALVCLALTATLAHGAEPVCALLDPEKVPRAALLEAKLLADPGTTWVERANTDAVLKEQKLQALFSPQGGSERARLGKLLKADLLVLVRPAKGSAQPALEVVVSETAGGLRLLVRAVPVTARTDEDLAALLAAVRDGIGKHRERITEVVAVPPFVSNDLEFTHDYLKGAYAKLAEAEALGRNGVVVVELEEAQALAKEIALSAPGAALDRPPPVYLLGEYRHDGAGQQRTVTLKLRAERAGKAVMGTQERKLKPEGAAAAVRTWAAGALDGLAKTPGARPPADPKAEAKLLAERAQMFLRIGNRDEGVALAEASLLLDPAQPALRVKVINALGEPLTRLRHEGAGPGKLKVVERCFGLYRRGLEHLEAFIDGGGDPAEYQVAFGPNITISFIAQFRNQVLRLGPVPFDRPEVAKPLRDAQEFERAVFARLLRAPVVTRARRDVHEMFVHGAIANLSGADQRAILARMINDLPDEAGSEPRARLYAAIGFWAGDKPFTEEECERFAAQIATGRPKFVAAVKNEFRQQELHRQRLAASAPRPEPPPPEANGVRLTRVPLTGAVPRAPNAQQLNRLYGILPIGPATDVVWDGGALYLMKEKGKLVPVRDLPRVDGSTANVVYDGRYVWASWFVAQAPSALIAFEPATGKTWNLTKAEGLPQPTPEFTKRQSADSYVIAPLAPGRICVAGSHGRAWVAVVTLDPVTGGSAKVIHEARDVPDRLDLDQWKRPTVAFLPGSARVLRGTDPGGKPVTGVLIGRYRTGVAAIDTHSLFVDPDAGTVRVVPEPILSLPQTYGAGGAGAEADGMVYFSEWALVRGPSRLMRMKLPGPVIEPVAEQLPPDIRRLHVDRQRVHAVEVVSAPPRNNQSVHWERWTSNWWTLEPGDARPRLVGSRLPEIGIIGTSAHYGLFALVLSPDDERRIELYTVEIVAPVAKK